MSRLQCSHWLTKWDKSAGLQRCRALQMRTGPVPLKFVFIAVLFGCSLDASDKWHKTERAGIGRQEHWILVGTGAVLGWKCKNASLPQLLSLIKKVNISQVGQDQCKLSRTVPRTENNDCYCLWNDHWTWWLKNTTYTYMYIHMYSKEHRQKIKE